MNCITCLPKKNNSTLDENSYDILRGLRQSMDKISELVIKLSAINARLTKMEDDLSLTHLKELKELKEKADVYSWAANQHADKIIVKLERLGC